MLGVDGGAITTHTSEDANLSPPLSVLDAFYSLIVSSSMLDLPDTFSFPLAEPTILPLALRASVPFSPHTPRSFDLSREPSSYSEAMARPDAPVWRSAMDRERQSLLDMGAFEEADLPPGQKAVVQNGSMITRRMLWELEFQVRRKLGWWPRATPSVRTSMVKCMPLWQKWRASGFS